MIAQRRNFCIARQFADPSRFVFLDESGAKTNMIRLYGRVLRGKRCRFYTPLNRWKTTTMVSAIRCTGVIEQATMVLDAPMDRDYFLGYTQQCLVPSLQRGDIVATSW